MARYRIAGDTIETHVFRVISFGLGVVVIYHQTVQSPRADPASLFVGSILVGIPAAKWGQQIGSVLAGRST